MNCKTHNQHLLYRKNTAHDSVSGESYVSPAATEPTSLLSIIPAIHRSTPEATTEMKLTKAQGEALKL